MSFRAQQTTTQNVLQVTFDVGFVNAFRQAGVVAGVGD
jgi:hypothetical protein